MFWRAIPVSFSTLWRMIKCRKWRLLSRFLKLSAFGVKPGHPSEKRQARPIHRPYCPLFTAPTTWLRRFAGGERAEADGESVRHLAELGFQNSGEEEEANWCGARVRESESSQRSAECFGRNNESRNGSHGRVIPEGNGGSLRGWQHFPLAPRAQDAGRSESRYGKISGGQRSKAELVGQVFMRPAVDSRFFLP